MQYKLSPIAFDKSMAATVLSTPPLRPSNTLSLFMTFFKSLTVVLTNDAGAQLGEQFA